MWIKYNPNPKKKNVEDCAIRALCKAMGADWDEIYACVSAYGYMLKDMAHGNAVWGAYLRKQGYKRYIVDDHGIDCYTVDMFCRDHPAGTFIVGCEGHVVCVEDGNYYDAWDSGDEVAIYFWKKA